MNELSILDLMIAIIVLIGMWRGFKMGLIQSIVSLVGWIIAFFAGTRFAKVLAPYFADFVESSVLQTALGFLTVVLIMMALIHIVASILKKILESLKLSFLDKLAGGVLGAARNVLIVLVILSMTAPLLIKLPMWQSSKLAQELLPFAPMAKTLLQDAFGEAWQQLNQGQGELSSTNSETGDISNH